MSELELQPLLGNGVNFSGMASFPPPDALPPGKMALAQNVRTAWGKPVVRLPLTTVGSPASSTGWCAGGAEMSQDGLPSLFVAIGYGPGIVNSNGTNFYVSRNAGMSWTTMGVEPGGATSPYGSTVFDSQDTRVEFICVTDRTWNNQTAYDLIVIQDGGDAPLIYGKSNSGTFEGAYGMSRVYQPPAPLAGTGLQFYTAFSNAWPLGTPGDITIVNGTNISISKGTNQFQGTLDPTYVQGSMDTVTAEFSTALNLTNTTGAGAGQFILIADGYTSMGLSAAAAYGGSTTTEVTNGSTTITTTTPAPIEITTSVAHGLSSGMTVTIAGIASGSCTSANGTWTVTVLDSTHFLLNGSAANGSGATGGVMSYAIPNFWWDMKVTLTDNAANSGGIAAVTVGTTTEIQTTAANTLVVGQMVTISGVSGTVAAHINGTWPVLSVVDATHFTVNVNTSAYAYTSGGSIAYGNGLELYDPATMFGTPVFLDRTDIGTVYGLTQIAYPLPTTTNGFNFDSVKYVSFAWEGEPPAVGIFWNVYEMASSGRFQGTTSFAAAYFSQDTRQIGPATYYPAVTPGPTNLGNGVTILDDQRFWYDYTVNVPALPVAALDAGVDSGLLYAQLPGQTQPYLCGQILLGEWAAYPVLAWQGVSSVSSGNYANDWTFFAQDLSWPALNGACLCLPTGVAMALSSERLFVGSGSTLWFSTAERPFQFYALQQSDPSGNLLPTSGASMQFDGQTIQAMLAIGSLSGGNEGLGDPALGAATIFVFTDRTVLMLSGWDASSLNKPARMYDEGTYAPWSVCAFQTGWMFWATDGHIIRYGVNPQMPYAGMYPYAVSRLIVEDVLKAVPDARVSGACGAVKDECYYLALSPAGATARSANTFALVWDYNESFRTQDNVWYEDVFPASVIGVARWFAYRSGARTHLMGFDASGQTIEHVTYGQSSDAPFAITGVTVGATTTVTTYTVLPGLAAGSVVTISGVTGTIASTLNGTFTVLSVGTQTFTLSLNTAGLVYSGGGSVLFGTAGVAWALVFPEVRGDGFMPVLVRRAVVHCDANIGTLGTSRLTQGRLAQASSSAVLSTATAGTRCVRYDNVVAGGSVIPGAAAAGVTFSLSGTSPSGSVVHDVSVEVGRLSADGPDVS